VNEWRESVEWRVVGDALVKQGAGKNPLRTGFIRLVLYYHLKSSPATVKVIVRDFRGCVEEG
jgi:hypothetical protein